MEIFLIWTGIALTIIGWLALAWQAFKVMQRKEDLDKFPELKHQWRLRRNYCRLTIIAGLLILLISLAIG